MMKKRIMTSAVLLGILSISGAQSALAVDQTILGKEGQNSADVTTTGHLGGMDDTDPEEQIPEGDDAWINVTLPTAVVFESDAETGEISSPKNYTIVNNSGRGVQVNVQGYQIINPTDALKSLSITNGTTNVDLLNAQGAALTEIDQEFTKLGNNAGNLSTDATTKAPASTSFEFRGTVDSAAVAEAGFTLNSTLTFKFIPLDASGNVVA